VEVLSVIINDVVEEHKFYGTITVDDDKDTVTIYNVASEDADQDHMFRSELTYIQ